jgi:serine protease Do
VRRSRWPGRLVAAAAAVAVVASGCGGAGARTTVPISSQTLTPQQIAERATPSVVLIKTPDILGTGFVVWQDGRIATNLHVIAGAREATVTLHDGRSFNQLQVLAVDREHDLAIVRIAGVRDLPVLSLGDSGAVKPGQRVVAIGHPMGLGDTISDGLVSAVRVLDPRVTLLQITAPIAPGSSGGPILDEHGAVIGVATLFSAEGQNLNFGVPVAYLKPMLLAEKPMPLAAFSQQVDMGLLEGCSIDEVKLAVSTIDEAIKIGAPLFNKGNHQGCFDVYQNAALQLVQKIKACQGIRETLLGGLTSANHAPGASDKAWAMRHAFDRILGAVEAALRQAEPVPGEGAPGQKPSDRKSP